MQDQRCSKCGAPLRTETVRYPVYVKMWDQETGTMEKVPAGYETAQEVSDCPRCFGAY